MALIVEDRVRDTTTTTGTGTITVTGTAPLHYRGFASVLAVNDTFPYAIVQQGAPDEWEVGIGTWASSTTFTRTTIRSSSNSDLVVSFSAGTKDVMMVDPGTPFPLRTITGTANQITVTNGDGIAGNPTLSFDASVGQAFEPSGRLTLTTGTPIMTSTTSAQATVYFTLYQGNLIPIYDGTSFNLLPFTELSQATTDTTKSPAAVANNSNYDIFGWSDAGTIRATRGPAWSSGTARGTGAGTTELVLVKGLWVNANAITNGPAAQRGTFLGSVRSNGTATIDWILGGAASGGTAAVLNIWNTFNRILAATTVIDNGSTYTYSSATIRQARASAGNQVTFLAGLAEDVWTATLNADVKTAAVGQAEQGLGLGLDSTSTFLVPLTSAITKSTLTIENTLALTISRQATLGSHIVSRNEQSDGTNANSFAAAISVSNTPVDSLLFVFPM